MQTWQMAVIAIAIIGIIYLILLAVAGFGSAESSAGHYLGSALNGTSLEQPAVSMEKAGEGLTATADNDIMGFTALLVVGLLIAAAMLDS